MPSDRQQQRPIPALVSDNSMTTILLLTFLEYDSELTTFQLRKLTAIPDKPAEEWLNKDK